MRYMICVVVIYGILCQNRCVNQQQQGVIIRDNDSITWTAKPNSLTSLPKERLMKLCGVHSDFKDNQLPKLTQSGGVGVITIPSSFDARVKWPKCKTIGIPRDQGACGSCWAFATTAAMSDRICIKSNARINVNISAQYPLSCCSTCGLGCNGGYPTEAWNFWVNNGIPTGGGYNSKQGCQPYTSQPYNLGITPNCSKTCQRGISLVLQNDLRLSLTAYSLTTSIRGIQTEILMNGPVCGVMAVYGDFPYYSKGVYQHVSGELLGYHAVKIIGWGIENKLPYWLVVNSWGPNWGTNGLFKVLQNEKDCKMESDVSAGIPIV